MTPQQLEQLLYEDESSTLDFKRDQYAFSKATEDEKSELLKDILGFVNCWRRADAFIVIGVEDVQGSRGIVYGITDHLQDHSLQQFVNNLTNRPVLFGYEAGEIEGKQVGIIRIELQRRPVYLKRDYGKLTKGLVYVRRGSSTDLSKPADPDEISHMGSSNPVIGLKEASLAVEFAALDREQELGNQIEWSAEYCTMPRNIPKLKERGTEPIRIPGGGIIQIPDISEIIEHDRLNPDYYQDLARYVFAKRLVRTIRLVVTNTGESPAKDVRLEVRMVNGPEYGIIRSSGMPIAPKRRISKFDIAGIRNLNSRHESSRTGAAHIEKTDHETKLEIDCGNLQPGRKVWTDEIRLAVVESGPLQIDGRLFAANLSKPQSFTLTINAQVTHTEMTVDELKALDDPSEEEG